MQRLTWDIFCSVVDNFGDLGVCWRLAKQLIDQQYAKTVRLWIDDWQCCQQWFASTIADKTLMDGIELRYWCHPLINIQPAQVVIAAFSCELPDNVVAAVAAQNSIYINLEYLSAEDWISDCHQQNSPHQQLALDRYFFFPGFTANSGGLLREIDLEKQRDQFLQTQQQAFWQSLQIPPTTTDEQRLSIFCYANGALIDLLTHLCQTDRIQRCFILGEQARKVLASWLGYTFAIDQTVQQGSLYLHALPWLSQTQYDRLLWACDINVVRGEDSFVRAQWAAKPFIWHCYPQSGNSHFVKIEAFLKHYLTDCAPMFATALRQLWFDWNRGGSIAHTFTSIDRIHWCNHAKNWSVQLFKQADLTSNLVAFAINQWHVRRQRCLKG